MIRHVGGRLVWSERDILGMARVLGPEYATKLQAPLLDSILRLAPKVGLQLEPILERRLADELSLRRHLAALRLRTDFPPTHPRERAWFAHQRADLAYMLHANRSAYLLGHQPGVGKTLVAIRWALSMAPSATRFAEAPRVLVVTMNSAKHQWRREIRRWGDDRWDVTIVEGSVVQQMQAATRDGWVIAHWEALAHARFGFLQKAWDVAILDEAHMIQNRDAQRSQTAHALDATYRLALTGHPFANAPDELWSILHFLYPEVYTSFWRFVGMHIKVAPKPFGGFDMSGARRPKLLQWEIGPFTLRRTKRDVFASLPPVVRMPRVVELPRAYRATYDGLRKQFFAELEGHAGEKKLLAIPSVLARITRLRQFLVDPQLIGDRRPSLKYPVVRELLDELDGPPVIFTSFAQAARRLSTYLGGHRKTCPVLEGRVPPRQRRQLQRTFLRGRLDALIVVTQAGGTALNLGKYGYVIHLDLPWTPKDIEQTEGRVDRPEEGTGRLVATTSYRVVVADSYEERLEAKLEEKFSRFAEVFTVAGLTSLFS